MSPFYITTPIYYVNDQPHLGHAYTTLAADTLARFARLQGREVFFLTGTDEHGLKVAKSAETRGLSPKAFADELSHKFQELFDFMDITYDDFIRTTQERHIQSAQHLWTILYNKGLIYKGTYSGWYSLRDEAYFSEEELVDGKAPSGSPVTFIKEECYFFKLSFFEKQLLDFYTSHPHSIGPNARFNEVISFIKSGLQDLCISRTNFSWGIPVPNDPGHVMYVWFDALTNYISALAYPEKSENFTTFWPHVIHLMGKDIIRFHGVYWPAMLMAAEINPPHRLFAHGFWTHNGQKMSKSLGNGVNPYEIIREYGLDQFRYFLLREIPFGSDGDFSKAALSRRINSDLSNNWGNLVQRTFTLIHKNTQGKVPDCNTLEEEDHALLSHAYKALEHIIPLIETQAIHKYVEKLWELSSHANSYIDLMAPWALAKTNAQRMNTVLYVLLETIRCFSILAQPIIPNACEKVLAWLAVKDTSFQGLENPLKTGQSLSVSSPLFHRVYDVD